MLFNIFLFVSLPCVGFLTGWRATEFYFISHLVPLPFEKFGLAAGLAGFFIVLGVLILFFTLSNQRRPS